MLRRGLCAALPLWFALASAPLQAAPALGEIRHLGVFSLVGDRIEIALNNAAPSDTRLERVQRDSRDLKGLDLDLIAAREAGQIVRVKQPGARVTMLRAPELLSTAQQREIAAGARDGGLPAWMVRSINERQFSHVLVITRARSAVSARTADLITIGRGQVEGVGFYIDTLYAVRNEQTGAVSNGLIAPFAHLHLQLLDAASGELVWSGDADESYAHAAETAQVQADPWTFMDAAEKIRVLRKLVSDGVQAAVTRMTTAPGGAAR